MTTPSSATPQDDTGRLKGNSEEATNHSVVMSLPDEQVKILRAFAEGDSDYCYGYAYFERETGLDRKTLKKHMTELRAKGIAYYARGLMNEDGEFAGSGFGINYSHHDLAHEALEAASDALEYQLKKDIKNALLYAGSVYDYPKRDEAADSIMRLVAQYAKDKGIDLQPSDGEVK